MRNPIRIWFLTAMMALGSGALMVQAKGMGKSGSPVGSHLIDVIFSFGTFNALATYSSDGVFTASDSGDFDDSPETPAYGAWRKTGPFSVESLSLFLIFDSSGTQTSIGKTTSRSETEDGFATGTFDAVIEVYALGKDPLDPDEVPDLTFIGEGTSRRISVP